MGRDELRQALEAMDDDDARVQMAQGDLSVLGDAALTDEERALVIAAADDYPEVVGFSFNALSGGNLVGDHKLSGKDGVIQKLTGPYADAVKIAGVFKF